MGNLVDKLTYLNGTKTAIKDVFVDAGISISNNDTFRSYAQKFDDYAVKEKIADLEKLKSTLPYTEATGTNITLEDTQELQLKNIQIQGNSKAYIKLPDEYQQVEYIESHGQEYIDTGLTPNRDTGFYIDFIPENTPTSSNSPNYFNAGGSGGSSNNRVGLNVYSTSQSVTGELQFFTFKKDPGITKDIRMQLSIIDKTITYNDGTTEVISVGNITASNSLLLFAAHNSPINRFSTMKLYNFKLYDGITLIRNYIPCYRKSDNEIGLYDIVNRVFYSNQGTGAFVKGQDISMERETGMYSVSGNINITISSDNIEDVSQTLIFPLLEGQKLCRRNDTEYDYLSDDGIVNILEQIDFSGLKSPEESFIVRQEPIITAYTEEQKQAYNRIKKAHSYDNITYINSTNDISPSFDVEVYQKNVINPTIITFQNSPASDFNLNLIAGKYLTGLKDSFRGCANLIELDLTNIDTFEVTTIQEICNGARNLKLFKIGNTPSLSNMIGAFANCNSLEIVSEINTINVTTMNNAFSNCNNLTDESLNNILSMCINAASYTGTKALANIGLSQAQAQRCQTLSNWADFVAAGWTA